MTLSLKGELQADGLEEMEAGIGTVEI